MRFRTILSHVRVTQNLQFLLSHYKYQPLPTSTSIRLLKIIPSEDRRIIQCSMKAFELEDVPPFRALSYTWGSPLMRLIPTPATSKTRRSQAPLPEYSADRLNETGPSSIYGEPSNSERHRRHSIICDGRIIKVNSNLKDALRMLASPVVSQHAASYPVYYWIDALCMDQQNVDERNAQVAKMAEIFQKAEGVVVWLGKEDEYTMDALTTIEGVSAIPEEDWPSVPYTSFYEQKEGRLNGGPSLSYQNWLGFIALINRPWFKRAWVCLSKPFICSG